jgi:hypothetical protein
VIEVSIVAGLDPVKAKANIGLVRTALARAALKPKPGMPAARVEFAFAPGKNKADHILMMDVRKKGSALMSDIIKIDKARKGLVCGSATVTKEGKATLWVKYQKGAPGAESKMAHALSFVGLQYAVVFDKSKPVKPGARRHKNRRTTAPRDAAGLSRDEDFRRYRAQQAEGSRSKVYKSHGPMVTAQLEKGLQKVDRILDGLDDSLAHALEKAAKAPNEAARKAELGKAKVILTNCVKYVQTEPLIKQLDDNPFGVQLNLQKAISASLRQVAQSIG